MHRTVRRDGVEYQQLVDEKGKILDEWTEDPQAAASTLRRFSAVLLPIRNLARYFRHR